ncbi:MAG: hypothetical protein JOZ55_09090, partial [Alphaproteobacteria bacterium]|nr:hypothetical protein [Alphaproteobacteria bacterium]
MRYSIQSTSSLPMSLPRNRVQSAAGFLILGCGFVLSVAANWPGQLSYDSVVQLAEGRSGLYGNWHPPVMSWLLGVGDAVLSGAGLFVLFDAGLVFGGLALAFGLSPRKGWAASAIALAFLFTPQLLLYPGIVWKDVLFAGAAVSGFLALGFAAQEWERRLARAGLLAISLLLLLLAALARQNGIVVLPLAALALGLIARRHAKHPRAGLAWGAGALLLSLALYAGGSAALHMRVVGQTGP